MSFVCGQTIAIWFAELLHIFLYSTIPLLFVQNCQCIAIFLEIVFVLVFCSKIALVFAANTIMLEQCSIFVVFVETYTWLKHFVIFNRQCKVFAFIVQTLSFHCF